MEDDLKMLKLEYLSNHLLDPTQMLNLSLDYNFCLPILEMKTTSNGRLPTQILNLSLDDQIILYKFFKWRRPPIEDDLKILKFECFSKH